MELARLEKLLHRVDDLPTLPQSVMRITEVVNNPQSSARDLARLVNEDQVLAARLLRLVNSSFYGFPQRISTVTTAVVLLGFEAMRNLLLSTSVFELFRARGRRAGFNGNLLWDHSLGCAVGAKTIGHMLRYDEIEELFVCGLLHDIGKIVEMVFMPEEFARAVAEAENRGLLLHTAEEKILGYSHAEVGRLLVGQWNLPAKIVHVVAHHHQPAEAGAYALEAAVVHVADILSRALSIGSGGDGRVPFLDGQAWRQLALETTDIRPVMQQMEAELTDVRAFVN